MSMPGERLPYPGLRSFTREETDLFFGREGCVDQMVDRLAATRFLAVLGASGSGKSSLVKTGLLDALDLGYLAKAGSRWLVADFKPGVKPVANMAKALLRVSSDDPTREPGEDEIRILRALLLRSPRSIVEWASDNLPPDTNLLLLVDQFEELFRYSEYAEREEAEAFVALLLESARAPLEEARIYVTITMRSEYLGAAALIDGLAETINKGLYLTPRMSREEVREAIVGPAAVCGFEIEPTLVNRLLNDLTTFAPWEEEGDTGHQLERLVRRADQLPLMQHVLNRLWSIAHARATGGKKVVLTLKDYQDVGGLRGALAAHGREILEELLPEHRAVAPTVFRALTSGSSLAEAVRRETKFGELVEIAHGDRIAVREIVDAFRAPGRNFLLPPRHEPLNADTVIDISHESLIRQWDEFASWLHQEAAAADSWRRLVDQAERSERGEADLLSGASLTNLANWWDTEQPTSAWAERYGNKFEMAKGFLERSRQAEASARDRDAEDRRRKSRNRLVTLAAVVIICLVTPLTIFAGYSAIQANRERAQADRQRELAEEQRLEAEEQRARAIAAQGRAETAAREADDERQRAAESARIAEEEQQRAEEQKDLADAARDDAEKARLQAEQAAAAADAAAELAKKRRQEAEEQRQRALDALAEAEQARVEVFQANLALPAQRAATLQDEGAWDAAADLLSTLWTDLLTNRDGEVRGEVLIDPIEKAFDRQSLAEYPIVPEFLSYSGYSGWTGTTGRFRVYDLDRTADDGTVIAGNKIMTVFDAMTGTVMGSFELPPGSDLGSEIDLVTPDGKRAAIVTDDNQIALWASGQAAPTMIPVPASGDAVVNVDQLAPVHTDDRFVIYLERDFEPSEIQIVDPAVQGVARTIKVDAIADEIGLESISSVNLLGLVNGKLYVLLNAPYGLVVEIDADGGGTRVLDTGVDVTGGAVTPDGQVLLTLSCPGGNCGEQKLTAYDLSHGNAALWVERVPRELEVAGNAVLETTRNGVPSYGILVENEGIGVVFQFPQGRPEERVRLDGRTTASIGPVSFDGNAGFRSVDSAGDDTTVGDVAPAGRLANFRVPAAREKLRLYVAPNSVAVYRDGNDVLLGGVTYAPSDGSPASLLVYRLEDGVFREDDRFRQIPVAASDCISAVGFGGNGRSLLIRHIDGSLLYVAAVGGGTSVGWHQPSASETDASRMELTESAPATNCDLPDSEEGAVTERIVSIDETGRHFALLDKSGAVWRVDIADREEGLGGAAREIAPLKRIARGAVWIADDAPRQRIALVSGASRTADDAKSTRFDPTSDELAENTVTVLTLRAIADHEGGATAAQEGAQPESEAKSTLPRRGEPKVATFTSEGGIVVAYSGGRLASYMRQEENWSPKFDVAVPKSPPKGIFATPDLIAVVDDRDGMTAYEAETGNAVGYAHIPGDPSVLALLEDGRVLSVEWITDGAATLTFEDLTAETNIVATARLVTMRSRLDPLRQDDRDRLSLLTRMTTMLPHSAPRSSGEEAPSPDDETAQETDKSCAIQTMLRLSFQQSRLLDEASANDGRAVSSECAEAESGAMLAAAESLADGSSAGAAGVMNNEGFSSLLAAAADGNGTATRLIGAALTRIATERGIAGAAAIAEDAARFGSSVPPTVLREVAGGAPIPPALLELAQQHQGFDPAAHQLVANALERRINDIDALTEALFHYAVAERLYIGRGRTRDARFAAHRRAQLARLLPNDRVLEVDSRREAWEPDETAIASGGVPEQLPDDAASRRAADIENADRLAERLPGSLLLDELRAELERARIYDQAASDPKQAADMMLDLGQRTEAEKGWSAELMRDYLTLADRVADDPESALRLSVEALKSINAAFSDPIHTNDEAVALFVEAADDAAAAAVNAPQETVVALAANLDLPLVDYQYATLPAPGEVNVPLVDAAERLLKAAERLADAVSKSLGGDRRWDTIHGDVLFWRGVLVIDEDEARTGEIFQASADAVQPIVRDHPDDDEARLRYAEALRWVGLTASEPERVEAAEKEALRHYEVLWEKRDSLSDEMVRQVGVGYGYDLLNLGESAGRVNLADIDDGRTADEHAAWVTETLALAADMHAVYAEMVDRGVDEGNSGFITGWNRMNGYGRAIGFLSGLVNVESGAEPTKCDVRAADPFDPMRRAYGVLKEDMDAANAESICKEETESDPDDARATFQLARAIYAQSGRESEAEQPAREAAAEGVAPAFSLVGAIVDHTDTTLGDQAHLGASQRVIIESFPILHPFLSSRASSDRDRMALAWYAEKAAALGVPEAQMVLAESAEEAASKLFHAKLAALLFDAAGDRDAAEAARRIADDVTVGQAESDRVDAQVADWRPEPLVALPEQTGDSS